MPDLERDLRALEAETVFPDTPDLVSLVAYRLPSGAPARRPLRLVLVVAIVVLAVAAGLAVPQTRAEILRFFGVGAVQVELVDRLPAVDPGAPLVLGEAIGLDEAPFRVLRPRLLDEPDGVYASGEVVTLLYGSERAVRLLVTEIAGSRVAPEVVKKAVASTTRAQFVSIRGASEPGLWIEGESHVLDLPGAPPRLAANTLVWRAGDLTLRLEGAARRDEALRIAESFD